MEKEKNMKGILIGVLITIIIILAGLLVYFVFIKKDNGVVDNRDKTTENSNEVTYNEEYFNNFLSTFLAHLHYYAYNKDIESFDNKEISMYLLYYYTDYANKNNLATYKDNGEITYNVSKKDVDELVLKTFGKTSYEIINQDNRNGIRKIDDKTYQVYYFATGFYSPNYRLSNTKIESDTAFVEYIVSGNTSMGEPADDKGVITFYLNKNGDNWNVTKIKYNENNTYGLNGSDDSDISINYNKLENELLNLINSGKVKAMINKCESCEGISYNNYEDAKCKKIELSANSVKKVIEKLKESENVINLPTSKICALYTYTVGDKLTIFESDDKKTLLVGYNNNGYAFHYSNDITNFLNSLS